MGEGIVIVDLSLCFPLKSKISNFIENFGWECYYVFKNRKASESLIVLNLGGDFLLFSGLGRRDEEIEQPQPRSFKQNKRCPGDPKA